jgi:hypothetical protein
VKDFERELKKRALYFIKGPWPSIVQERMPQVFEAGESYIVVILKAEK